MSQIEIKIPQLGEGLQEARLVQFLKQPGDHVKRDEPIYEMETDKAVMEIESPAEGVLGAWTAAVDDILPIGATIGHIEVGSGAAASAPKPTVTPELTASPATVSADVEIRIPQLGEGLQEARIVRFLKQPGDSVQQDETIYEMETDKAVMEIESPTAGTLVSWSAKEDDVLEIGAVIGVIRSSAGVAPPTSSHDAPAPAATAPYPRSLQSLLSDVPAMDGPIRAGLVPPRTHTYAKSKGMTDDQLSQLARSSDKKLLPEDIDAFLAGKGPVSAEPKSGKGSAGETYSEGALGGRQKTLNFRLHRSAQTVIPATMELQLNWGPITKRRAELKSQQGETAPSAFVLFAWCVAQASKEFPRFRAALTNDSTLRQYDHLHLGIAVARPGDELLMARIVNSDALAYDEFVTTAQAAIARARDGEDQTTEAMQISLTNMSSAGIRWGIPVVVAPSAGTLFIGAPFDEAVPKAESGFEFVRVAKMVFTFDHRIANGIGAAKFLSAIKERVEGF
ncbi:MAG: biotin/lipoyl-containing protein [Chthonomonadales bacterium]